MPEEKGNIIDTRDYPRVELNKPVIVSIGKKRVLCTIHDLSFGGAHLIVDKEEKETIAQEDVGEKIVFVIGNKGSITFNGVVVRVLFENEERHVIANF